jgi:heme-degrading monooxygenase HmoA
MILEMAVLNVKPGRASAFEAAMQDARALIAASDGFEKMELRPCIETKSRYLLLVWWDTVESHTLGFRESERYKQWAAALHDFYEPFPTVEHYESPL